MFWGKKTTPNDNLEHRIRGDCQNPRLWEEFFGTVWTGSLAKARVTCWCSEEEAQDRVQEAYEIVWEKRNNLDKIRETLQAYTYGVIRNKCMEWLRNEKRLQSASETLITDVVTATNPANFLTHNEGIDKAVAIVNQHFDQLPNDWEIVKLKHLQKQSHTEIAQQLRIRVDAAKQRLSRAIKRLSELCAEHNITAYELREAIVRRYDNETTE